MQDLSLSVSCMIAHVFGAILLTGLTFYWLIDGINQGKLNLKELYEIQCRTIKFYVSILIVWVSYCNNVMHVVQHFSRSIEITKFKPAVGWLP